MAEGSNLPAKVRRAMESRAGTGRCGLGRLAGAHHLRGGLRGLIEALAAHQGHEQQAPRMETRWRPRIAQGGDRSAWGNRVQPHWKCRR